MKALKLLLVFTLLFSLFSCSSKKSKKVDETSDKDIAGIESDADFIVEDEDEKESPEAEKAIAGGPEEEGPTLQMPETYLTENFSNYNVESGDTYMLIAFKLYGDNRKWRAIANDNPRFHHLKLRKGQTIKYRTPETDFKWNPEGLPYLIKSGDTLGSISSEKYGSTKKWRFLWQNNRPMIRNPDLIFSGFTLYYKQDGEMVSSR